MRKVNIVLIHSAVWILYIAFAILVYGYGNDLKEAVYETSVSYLLSISVFYLHSEWILPAFFERKKYNLYIGMLLVLYAYCMGIKYFFAFIFDPLIFKIPSSAVGVLPGKVFLVFSFQWFNFTIYSTGYWLAKMLLRTQKEASEKEKIELENIALRAKLNPHFLFNVLESFRIECKNLLPNLSSAIGSLIFITRASILEPGPDGLIPLNREIKSIQCYLSIFKRRYPEHFIGFTKQIVGNHRYRILPHILLEFVENAVKHGDYKDPEDRIDIRLKVCEDNLHFHIRNKKRGNFSEAHSTGIGLNNIKKHLETGYAANHELIINDTPYHFEVDLRVKALKRETMETIKLDIYDEQNY